jgi:hypothetical protein
VRDFHRLHLVPDRTTGHAGSAAGALRLVHVARSLFQRDGEIPRLPLDPLYFAQGENLNVFVAADFHQARRHRAHGAVVRGKRLIKLRHHPADGRLVFHEVYLDAGAHQIEGRLHPANAAADHQAGADRLRPGFFSGHN